MKPSTKNYYNLPDYFSDFFWPSTFGKSSTGSLMKTDISLRKGNYVFDIEIPGYQKDDIKAELKDGYLNVWVEGNKHGKTFDTEDSKWLHQERFNGEVSRSFYVGCSNDASVNASYHNGVLTVVIPEENTKKENTKYINIQ